MSNEHYKKINQIILEAKLVLKTLTTPSFLCNSKFLLRFNILDQKKRYFIRICNLYIVIYNLIIQSLTN